MYFLLNIHSLLAENCITAKIEISSTPAQTSTSGQEANSTKTQWAWNQAPQNLQCSKSYLPASTQHANNWEILVLSFPFK